MFLKSWRSFRNATDVSGVDFSRHATFAFSKTDSPREKQPGEGRGLAGIRDLETLVLSDRQARSFTLRFRPARLRTRRKRYRHLRRIPHWLACSVSQDKFKTDWLFMLLRRLRFLWRKIVKCLGVAEQPGSGTKVDILEISKTDFFFRRYFREVIVLKLYCTVKKDCIPFEGADKTFNYRRHRDCSKSNRINVFRRCACKYVSFLFIRDQIVCNLTSFPSFRQSVAGST